MLYFEGGGWCYDEDDCVERSKTTLGSSKYNEEEWKISELVPGGILSRDCDVNPGIKDILCVLILKYVLNFECNN